MKDITIKEVIEYYFDKHLPLPRIYYNTGTSVTAYSKAQGVDYNSSSGGGYFTDFNGRFLKPVNWTTTKDKVDYTLKSAMAVHQACTRLIGFDLDKYPIDSSISKMNIKSFTEYCIKNSRHILNLNNIMRIEQEDDVELI